MPPSTSLPPPTTRGRSPSPFTPRPMTSSSPEASPTRRRPRSSTGRPSPRSGLSSESSAPMRTPSSTRPEPRPSTTGTAGPPTAGSPAPRRPGSSRCPPPSMRPPSSTPHGSTNAATPSTGPSAGPTSGSPMSAASTPTSRPSTPPSAPSFSHRSPVMPMSLAALLALFPDNTSGQIGADDMRTTVTELYQQPANVPVGGTTGQVLTKNSPTDWDTGWTTPTGGTGGVTSVDGDPGPAVVLTDNYLQLLIPTAVKTANYTAAARDLVLVDSTSGTITITLPSAPPDATVIGVRMVTSTTPTVSA